MKREAKERAEQVDDNIESPRCSFPGTQEKKEHDEVKKDLDAIKELNIEDLLPRKKTRPEDEIKVNIHQGRRCQSEDRSQRKCRRR